MGSLRGPLLTLVVPICSPLRPICIKARCALGHEAAPGTADSSMLHAACSAGAFCRVNLLIPADLEVAGGGGPGLGLLHIDGIGHGQVHAAHLHEKIHMEVTSCMNDTA